jgi:TBC1 domain family member 10
MLPFPLSGMPLKFDSLGFVAGSGPDFLPPRESSEVQEAWHKILNENDLAAARKSRKVKKMVRDGIPA